MRRLGVHPRDEDVRAARDQIAGTRLSTIGGFYSALMAHDELAALSALTRVPVCILVGSRDLLTPKRHALAEAMPDAQLEILDGFGHMLTYEAPDEVCAALTSLLPEGGHPTPYGERSEPLTGSDLSPYGSRSGVAEARHDDHRHR